MTVIVGKVSIIIAEGTEVDMQRLVVGVKLALSDKIPIEDQKDNILKAFAKQAHELKKHGKEPNVRKIARILSLFFKFPKMRGKGYLQEGSTETEIYKSIRDMAETEEINSMTPKNKK